MASSKGLTIKHVNPIKKNCGLFSKRGKSTSKSRRRAGGDLRTWLRGEYLELGKRK
jgi:hypothetical protein